MEGFHISESPSTAAGASAMKNVGAKIVARKIV
jgi:hypothetical protein